MVEGRQKLKRELVKADALERGRPSHNWLLYARSTTIMAATRKHVSGDLREDIGSENVGRPAKRTRQDDNTLLAQTEDDDELDEYDAGPSQCSKASDLYLDTVSLSFLYLVQGYNDDSDYCIRSTVRHWISTLRNSVQFVCPTSIFMGVLSVESISRAEARNRTRTHTLYTMTISYS